MNLDTCNLHFVDRFNYRIFEKFTSMLDMDKQYIEDKTKSFSVFNGTVTIEGKRYFTLRENIVQKMNFSHREIFYKKYQIYIYILMDKKINSTPKG
jgi:hypothetical protein